MLRSRAGERRGGDRRHARDSIRGTDLVACYGGDEFVLILPDLPLRGSERIARRIREGFGAWAAGEGLDCNVTIGIGEAPTHGASLDAMLDSVDRAMYATKACNGVDSRCVCYIGAPARGAGGGRAVS